MSWDEVHEVQQPAGYNQPPDDAWDAYEQKKEELINDVWEMSVSEFEQEMDGFRVLPTEVYEPGLRLGKVLRRAVSVLAQERLEAYIADNIKGDY